MSSDVKTEVLDANGRFTARGGRFFMLLESPGLVTLAFERSGSVFGGSVEAGFVLGPLMDPFDRVRITGTPAGTIKYIVGDEISDYRRIIALFQESPSSAISDTAPVACASGALTVVVAAGTRRRVTLTVDPDFAPAAGYVYVRRAGGAQNLMPLQPGIAYEFVTSAGLSVRNDTGTAATVYVFEET